MTQSELILEYIDGTLDAETEQRLFDEMARHPELRSELRQFISMGDAVRSDREAFMPPAFVEKSLMAGLGLTPLMSGGAASTGGSLLTTGWFGKFGSMLAAFLVGALLAGGGVYLATGDGETVVAGDGRIVREDRSVTAPAVAGKGEGTGESVISGPAAGRSNAGHSDAGRVDMNRSDAGRSDLNLSVAQNAAVSPRESNADVASMRSGSRGTSRSIGGGSINTIPEGSADGDGKRARSAQGTQERSNDEATEPAAAIPAPEIVPVELRSEDLLPPADAAHTDRIIREAELPAGYIRAPMSEPQDNRSSAGEENMILEGRYMFTTSAFETRARATPRGTLENMAFGAYFDVGGALYVGAEAGAERYAQTLFVNSSDTLAIDQKPMYNWLGLAVRYTYPGRIPLVEMEPYFQMTGAYTEAGPLLRFRLAAAADLGYGFSITPAFEASSLLYTFNNQQLFSGRYGFTAGLEKKFDLTDPF